MLDIKDTVDELYYSFQTRNPFKIIHFMNGNVCFLPLGLVAGYSSNVYGTWIVCINTDIMNDDKITSFVLFHEIGHKVLHHKQNDVFLRNFTSCKNKFELEADEFALHFMLTDEDLLNAGKYGIYDLCHKLHIEPHLFEKVINSRTGRNLKL